MEAGSTDFLTILWMGVLSIMFAGSAAMLGVWLYNTFFHQFVEDLSEEAASGAGARNVIIGRLGVMNRRFMWPGYEVKMRRNLIKAGEPSQLRPEDIMAWQEVGFVIGLLFGLVAASGVGANLLWGLLGALFGLWYPTQWVRDQVTRRHHLITRALPYNLDLLTLSVEAGLDFTGALGKVVEKGKEGPLRDELSMVLKQLKMGKTREEALRSMVVRVDLPALTSFVNALIQADRMGTSLGKVLRIQSTQLRIDRTQRAEKLAGEAPVKMLGPLVLCIFPTVFMILFGPILYAFKFGNAAG
ncbi:MAG TPA: type II secretion system F family protein [Myxococcaceae bacterium]|nr:type II secretion system F family protein [Myxococcaceae bacterium]